MSPEPGAVYRVDLGISGKVRFFVVVSRRDDDPPRALALCVPITTQAIQFHELQGPVGRFTAPTMEAIRDALRYAMDL